MIYTPRGLKVRLPFDLVFALIARLSPKVSAFKVLQTTEAFEILPRFVSFIATIILYLYNQEIVYIVITVVIIHVFLNFYCYSGLNIVPPFVIHLVRYFSIIHGYGLYLLVLIFIGLFTIGWQGIGAYFIGRFIAGLFNIIINHLYLAHKYKMYDTVLTLSEINFFNSYRFYAKKIGVSTDIEVQESELDKDNWYDTYKELEYNWPKLVKRFYL